MAEGSKLNYHMVGCSCGCGNHMTLNYFEKDTVYLSFGSCYTLRTVFSFSEWWWNAKQELKLLQERVRGREHLIWEAAMTRDDVESLLSKLKEMELGDEPAENSSFVQIEIDPDIEFWLEVISRQSVKEVLLHPNRGFEIEWNRKLRDQFVETCEKLLKFN